MKKDEKFKKHFDDEVKEKDLETMKKNLATMKTSNKASMRFQLTNLANYVGGAIHNQVNCICFLKADGIAVFNHLFDKTGKDKATQTSLLKIFVICVKELMFEEYLAQFIEGKTIEAMIKLITDNFLEDVENLCYEILYYLSGSRSSQRFIRQTKIDQFLISEISGFKLESKEDINRLKKAVWIFRISKNLIARSSDESLDLDIRLSESLSHLYGQVKDIDYMTIQWGQLIYEISSSKNESQFQKYKFEFDFDKLVNEAVRTKNFGAIQNLEYVGKGIINVFDLWKISKDIQSGKKSFLLISFLFRHLSSSSKSLFVDENERLIGMASNMVKAEMTDFNEFIGALRFLTDLFIFDTSQSNKFASEVGMLSLKKQLLSSSKDMFLLTELYKMISELVKSCSDSIIKETQSQKIVEVVFQTWESYKEVFEEFSLKALTISKARESIEYNLSTLSREILLLENTVKVEELVSRELAETYLSSEVFVVNSCILVSEIFQRVGLEQSSIPSSVINSFATSIKVFKGSQEVYTEISRVISLLKDSEEISELIVKLNWPFLFSNALWLNSSWKKIGLYQLRFFDNQVSNEKNLKLFKQGTTIVRFIAAIKHLANEEELEDLEEQGQSQRDQLSEIEQRELEQKTNVLVEKLIDSSTLQGIRKNINDQINNFKPVHEVIQILRAECALLATIHSINFFGTESIGANTHVNIQEYIKTIEKRSDGKDFQNKELLMVDCLKGISNFVCITWNENGINSYVKAGISEIVFELLIGFSHKFNKPIGAFVIFRAFKEWLLNRITIIEKSNKNVLRISGKEHFTLLSNENKDRLFTSVLDSLYSSLKKWSSYPKIISIVLEILKILTYQIAEIKSKVVNNFTVQILNMLTDKSIKPEQKMEMIHFVQKMTGTSNSSEKIDVDTLIILAENNGLAIITKELMSNQLVSKNIHEYKPLMEALANLSQNDQLINNLLVELIKDIKEFNSLSPEEKIKVENIKKGVNAIGNIQTIFLVDKLKSKGIELGYTEDFVNYWDFIQKEIPIEHTAITKAILEDTNTKCSNYMQAMTYSSDGKGVLPMVLKSKSRIIKNCLEAMRLDPKNEQVVLANINTINSLSENGREEEVRKLVQGSDTSNVLETLYVTYVKDSESAIKGEVTNFYISFAKELKPEFIKNIIERIFVNWKKNLEKGNIKTLKTTLDDISQYSSKPEYQAIAQKSKIDDLIYLTLKVIKSRSEKSMEISVSELVRKDLEKSSLPGLSDTLKSQIQFEILACKALANFINLQGSSIKEIILGNQKVVDYVYIIPALCRYSSSLKLISDFSVDKVTSLKLTENPTLYSIVVLLLGECSDGLSDSQETTPDNLNQSSIAFLNINPVRKNTMNNMNEGLSLKKQIRKEYWSLFKKTTDNMFNEKTNEKIIKDYASSLSHYKFENLATEADLFKRSRFLIALMKCDKCSEILKKYQKPLKEGWIKLLESFIKQETINDRLVLITNSIMKSVFKALSKEKDAFSSARLWNYFLTLFLIKYPSLLTENSKKIFSNLEKVSTLGKEDYYQSLFRDKSESFEMEVDAKLKKLISSDIESNYDLIISRVSPILSSGVSKSIVIKSLLPLLMSTSCLNKLVSSELFNGLLREAFNVIDQTSNETSLLFDFIDILALVVKDLASLNIGDRLDEGLSKIVSKIVERMIKISDTEDMSVQMFKLLGFSFDILRDRSVFFNQKVVILLCNKIDLKSNWKSSDSEMVKVATKLLSDESIRVQSKESDQSAKFVSWILASGVESLKETDRASPMKSESPLSSNSAAARFESICLVLSKLSFVKENKSQLCYSKSIFVLHDFYRIMESAQNQLIVVSTLCRIMRNCVGELDEEIIPILKDKITYIVNDIPSKLELYKPFKVITENLVTLAKQLGDKLGLAGNVSSIVKNSADESDSLGNVDTSEFNSLLEMLVQINKVASLATLQGSDLKLHNEANSQLTKITSEKNTMKFTGLVNLGITKLLLKISKAGFTTSDQSLLYLTHFENICSDPVIMKQMIKNDAHYHLIKEYICSFVKKNDLEMVSKLELKNELLVALAILTMMTGVKLDINFNIDYCNSELPVGHSVQKILENSFNDPEISRRCALFLFNAITRETVPKFETNFLKIYFNLLNKHKTFEMTTAILIEIGGLLCLHSVESKDFLVKNNIVSVMGSMSQAYLDSFFIHDSSSFTLLQICLDNQPIYETVVNSVLFNNLPKFQQNVKSFENTHSNILKIILLLSYQNNEKKNILITKGFAKNLPALLQKYSTHPFESAETCNLILKVMANLSTQTPGASIIANDHSIIVMKEFFNKHKEDMRKQQEIMIATIANMNYDPKQPFIPLLVKEGAVELIVNTLQEFSEPGEEDCLEIIMDTINHFSFNSICLEKFTFTNIISQLSELLRMKNKPAFLYKCIKAVIGLSALKQLAFQIISKEIHSTSLEILLKNFTDAKLSNAILKLFSHLLERNEEHSEAFYQIGIPDKLLKSDFMNSK